MPVYNTNSSWLEQSILSCLNQTIQNFELLIIDNDSTDEKTLNTLNRFKNIDKVKILKSPKISGKRGVSTSLNMGIKNSIYDYIARMDSDDWMYPERLEIQTQFLDKNNDVDILGTQIKIIQTNFISSHPEVINKENIINGNIHWFMNHPTVMFRKTLFEKVGLYQEEPELFPEDLELWTRCISKNIKIRNLPNVLLNYNYHNTNTSHIDGNSKQWNDCKAGFLNRLL